MPIKHQVTSGKADPVDVTLIKPSHWNAGHEYPAFTIMAIQFGNDPRETASPAAGVVDAYSAERRMYADLTQMTQVRIAASVAQNVSSPLLRLAVQYSLNDGGSWAYLDGVDGPYVALAPIGIKVGAWATLAALAKTNVLLRWVYVNGTSNSFQMYHHYLQGR